MAGVSIAEHMRCRLKSRSRTTTDGRERVMAKGSVLLDPVTPGELLWEEFMSRSGGLGGERGPILRQDGHTGK